MQGRLSYVAGALQQFHTRASSAWAVVPNLAHNLWAQSVLPGNGVGNPTGWQTAGVTSLGMTVVQEDTGVVKMRRINATGFEGIQQNAAGTFLPGISTKVNVLVRVPTGVNTADLLYYGGITQVVIAAAATLAAQPRDVWVAYSLTFTPNSADSVGALGLGNATAGYGFDIKCPQLQVAAYSGGGYTATGASAVPYLSLQTYAANVLRVLPSPVGVMAALREPASTNSIPNSVTPAFPVTDAGSTVTTGLTGGLDASASVFRLTPALTGGTPDNTSVGKNRWAQEIAGANGAWTNSVYVKTDAVNAQVTVYVIDMATDVVRGSTTVTTNGTWQRVVATGTTAGASTGVRYLIAANQAVLCTLPQAEPLPYATQPIPTTGAAVTRSADQIRIPQSLPSAGPFTLYASVCYPTNPVGTNVPAFSIDAGSQDWYMVYATGAAHQLFANKGGVTQANFTTGNVVYGGLTKVAATFGNLDFAGTTNGGAVASVATGSVTVPANPICLGEAQGTPGYQGVLYVHEFRITPRRLTNLDMAQQTA